MATVSGSSRAAHRTARAFGLLLFGLVGSATGLVGQSAVLMTVPEALELAFPDCKVERTRRTLDAAQKTRITAAAGHDVACSIVRPYVAKKDGKLVGVAYFDRHRVRSKDEVLMVVVDPQHRIERVEVLAFAEPQDYMPRDTWYALYRGRPLDKQLAVRAKIKPVTGSTLTVNATTRAARRTLAIHAELFPAVAATAKAEARKDEGARAEPTKPAKSADAVAPKPQPASKSPKSRPTSRPSKPKSVGGRVGSAAKPVPNGAAARRSR